MRQLTRERIESLLTELGERLAAQGVAARIYVVGGAALALEWDPRRSTRDIDAVLQPATTVMEIAAQMSRERHLPPGWLSDAATAFVPARDDGLPGRTLAVFDRVAIVIAPAEHLLAMKMGAFRQTDMADLRLLVRHLGLTTPKQIADLCEQVYGPDSLVLPSREDLLWQADVILTT